MAVFKANVQENFFVLTNDVARNENISLEAKGLIMVMASRPNGWKFNKQQLMNECSIGRDKLNRLFKELINNGFLAVTQNHDKQGLFTNSDYYFFSTPTDNPAFIPCTEKPYTDNPYNGESAPIKERDIIKERELQNVQLIIERGFGIFWENYPKKVGKDKAINSYNKLMRGKSIERIKELTGEMVEYINYCVEQLQQGEKKYLGYDNLNAATYINQKRWEDEK